MTAAHLRNEDWITLVESGGDAEQRRHVEACPSCRATLAEVAEGSDLAREADVPEPSPVYWDSFRHGVGRRIAQETASRSRWGSVGFRWAMAATVLVSLSLSSIALRERVAPLPPAVAALPAWSPLMPSEDDPGLPVLEALDVSDLSHASCGDVSSCLAAAADEDGEPVIQALQQELKGRPL